jgi:hypothetical protein
MIITAAIPAAAIIGGAIVVVAGAAGAIRHVLANRSPHAPPGAVTVDVPASERPEGWEARGLDWPTVRERIVHGDPFSCEAVDASSFTLTFSNELGVDAIDVVVDFRDFEARFLVEGADYRFDRMVQGQPWTVAIKEGAAVQGRIPAWVSYTIDGDLSAERHIIDLSVLAFGK